MNSKQIRLIFGIIGFAATAVAGYFLYNNNFSQVYIFSIVAAIGLYTYVTTRSNLAVLGIVCLHVIALILLSKSGSLMYLSIPYMALPFIALLPRGVLIYERLKHHLLLWMEP